MKSTSENKLTIAVLYIANYVALIIFVILFCLHVIDTHSPVFIIFFFLPLALFVVNTCMIKEKWYHFLCRQLFMLHTTAEVNLHLE